MAAQQFWAQVFYGLVFFVSAGFLWFFVVRPILEGWGIIRARDETVNPSEAAPPDDYVTIKRSALLSWLSDVKTDNETDKTDSEPTKLSQEQLLTHYRWLRGHGIGREDARAALKGVGLPLNNNLWAEAAPPESVAPDETVTPIAGRTTKASNFRETDPELAYKPLSEAKTV